MVLSTNQLNMTSRQDGSPFLNLLLIAPLYDGKGIIRYFLGAQVDINGLIEEGRGLDSFARLLAQDRSRSSHPVSTIKTPKAALAELSGYLNEQERDAIHHHGAPPQQATDHRTRPAKHAATTTGRRMIGMSEGNYDDTVLWPSPHLGPNGRLPGVFQNVCLKPRSPPSIHPTPIPTSNSTPLTKLPPI